RYAAPSSPASRSRMRSKPSGHTWARSVRAARCAAAARSEASSTGSGPRITRRAQSLHALIESQARAKDDGVMIRSSRLSLAVALVSCAASAALARAADPTLPPPTAPAETTVSFPSPHVRRWQVGVRADRLQHASLSMALGLGVGL